MPFLGQNGRFTQNRKCLGKIINIISIYLLTPFVVQNFKIFLEWIQSYGEDAPFLDTK